MAKISSLSRRNQETTPRQMSRNNKERSFQKLPRPEIYGKLDLSGVPQDIPIVASKPGAKSPYKGVTPNGNRGWQARIKFRGEDFPLGTFASALQAAKVYARAVHYLQHEGLPKKGKEFLQSVPTVSEKKKKKESKASKPRQTVFGGFDLSNVPEVVPLRPAYLGSKLPYKGVRPQAKGKKWQAYIVLNNKFIGLGTFKDMEYAALVHSRVAYYIQKGGRPNIGTKPYKTPKAKTPAAVEKALLEAQERKTNQESGYDVYGGFDLSSVPQDVPLLLSRRGSKHPYKGVEKRQNGKWRANVVVKGKRWPLGTFETMEEAALVHSRVLYYLKHLESESDGEAMEDSDSESSLDSTGTIGAPVSLKMLKEDLESMGEESDDAKPEASEDPQWLKLPLHAALEIRDRAEFWLSNITSICDASTHASRFSRKASSVLLAGCRNGSILGISFRPFLLAGHLYHPTLPRGVRTATAITFLSHLTTTKPPTSSNTNDDEAGDSDALQPDGTVLGKLVAIQESGKVNTVLILFCLSP